MITAMRLMASIEGDTKGLESARDRSRRIMDDVKQNVEQTGSVIREKFTQGWNAVATGAEAAGARAIASMTRVRQAADQLGNTLTTTGAAATALFTAPAAAAARAGLMYSDFEKRTVRAFTNMLKSEKEAVKFFKDIENFAAYTPFESEGIIKNAQALKGLKVETDEILPKLKALGDYSAQNGISQTNMNGALRQMIQMMGKGKVMTQDLNVMAENGVRSWELLAAATGKSRKELTEMVEKGTIDATYAFNAMFSQMEKEAPKAMEKMQDTIEAQLATMKDLFKFSMRDLFSMKDFNVYEIVVGALTKVNDYLGKFKDVIHNWSSDTKKEVLAGLGGFAAIGPSMVALAGFIKLITTATSPIGLFGAAIGLVVRYLIRHQDEAKKLADLMKNEFSRSFGSSEQAMQAVDNVGKLLVDLLTKLIPIIADVVKWVSDAAEWFGKLDPAVQTAMASVAGGIIIWSRFGGAINGALTFMGSMLSIIPKIAGAINSVLIPALTAALTKMGIASNFSIGTGTGATLTGASGAATTGVAALGSFAIGYGIGTAIDQTLGAPKFDRQAAATEEQTKAMEAGRVALNKYTAAKRVLASLEKDLAQGGWTARETEYYKQRTAEVEKYRIAAAKEADIVKGRLTPGGKPTTPPKATTPTTNIRDPHDPGAFKEKPSDKEAQRAAKALENLYQSRLNTIRQATAALKEQYATDAAGTEMAKVRYQIEKGKLGNLTEQKKAIILNAAAEQDAWQQKVADIEKFRQTREELDNQVRASADALSLGLNPTEAERVDATLGRTIDNLTHKTKTLTDAQKAYMEGQRQRIVNNQREIDHAKAMESIRRTSALQGIGDRTERDFQSSMGEANVRMLKAEGAYAEALRKFKQNLKDASLEQAKDQIDQLTFSIENFGKEGYQAAVQAFGGMKRIKELGISQDDINRLAKFLDYQRVWTTLMQQREGMQQQLIEAQRRWTTESQRTNEAFDRLLDPSKVMLTEEQRQAIEKLRKEMAGLAQKMDEATSKRWRDDQLRNFTDATAAASDQIALMFDPAQQKMNEWMRQNRDMLDQYRAINGDVATQEMLKQVEAEIRKQDVLEKNLAIMQKIQGMQKDIGLEAEKLRAKSPFEAWLTDFMIFDEKTRSWKLPEWIDKDQLKRMYEAQEMMKMIQEGAQNMAGVVTDSIMKMFTPDQNDVARLQDVNKEIRELKRDIAKDPANEGLRNQLRQLEEDSSRLTKRIHNDLGSMFDRLWKGIYAGFRDMLVKMAQEYLQSQLAQLFMYGMSKAFGFELPGIGGRGVGNGGGGGIGSLPGVIMNLSGAALSGTGVGSSGNYAGQTVPYNTAESLYNSWGNNPGYAYGSDYIPANTDIEVGEYGTERIRAARPISVIPHHALDDEGRGGDTFHIQLVLPNVTNTSEFRRAAPNVAKEALDQANRARRRNG